MGEQYYIGGKRYSPEESIELCTYERELADVLQDSGYHIK